MDMILTNVTALSYNGLIYSVGGFPYIATWRSQADGVRTLDKVFLYSKYFYDTTYMRQLSDGIMLPTPERTIVEYVLNEKHCDEGLLIEALKSYNENGNANYQLLYEVAEHFKLSRDILDYWLKEAREDSEV